MIALRPQASPVPRIRQIIHDLFTFVPLSSSAGPKDEEASTLLSNGTPRDTSEVRTRTRTRTRSRTRRPNLNRTKAPDPEAAEDAFLREEDGNISASEEMSTRTSSTFNEFESDEDNYPPSYASSDFSSSHIHTRLDLVLCLIVVISIGWAIGLLLAFPFPTTIPVFVAGFMILAGWTFLTWGRLLFALGRRKESILTTIGRYSSRLRTGLAIATVILCYLSSMGFVVPSVEAPELPTEINGVRQKYFIAANLHNNEAVMAKWSEQLLKLVLHLGRENTFISIYESNSKDSTKSLLSTLNTTLAGLSVEHRIVTEDDDKHWWPSQTSFERIEYLAKARNKALEPIQVEDDNVRLENWEEYTKILFLNDIWFNWQSMAKLLDTRVGDEEVPDYDQACAMDFDTAGLYDSWAARDVCGTPLRIFWPYVKDPVSIQQMEKEQPFPVSSCWNGAVALKADPFLYRWPSADDRSDGKETVRYIGSIGQQMGRTDGTNIQKRGWRMVDNATYPNSEFSPPVSNPLQFRTSNISACDHSECFLIGYDLHRMAQSESSSSTSSSPSSSTLTSPSNPQSGSGPKIYMNPQVKVAYEQNWYRWNNVVLRIPVIHWWLTHWSRGIPLLFVDWIWEHFGRRRDYCTWSALAWHMPDRCPALPGAAELTWEQ